MYVLTKEWILFAHSEKLFAILHDKDLGPAIGLAFGIVIALAPSSGHSCSYTWAEKLSNTDGPLVVLTYPHAIPFGAVV